MPCASGMSRNEYTSCIPHGRPQLGRTYLLKLARFTSQPAQVMVIQPTPC